MPGERRAEHHQPRLSRARATRTERAQRDVRDQARQRGGASWKLFARLCARTGRGVHAAMVRKNVTRGDTAGNARRASPRPSRRARSLASGEVRDGRLHTKRLRRDFVRRVVQRPGVARPVRVRQASAEREQTPGDDRRELAERVQRPEHGGGRRRRTANAGTAAQRASSRLHVFAYAAPPRARSRDPWRVVRDQVRRERGRGVRQDVLEVHEHGKRSGEQRRAFVKRRCSSKSWRPSATPLYWQAGVVPQQQPGVEQHEHSCQRDRIRLVVRLVVRRSFHAATAFVHRDRARSRRRRSRRGTRRALRRRPRR